jgi:hypothetical protein
MAIGWRFGYRSEDYNMSYNSQYVLTAEQASQLVEQRTNELLAKHIHTTTWYDPERNIFFKANNPLIENEPQYDIKICDGELVGAGYPTAIRGGSMGATPTEIDNARYNGIADEFQDEAIRFWKDIDNYRKDPQLRAGGFLTAQSYPSIANVMVDTSLLELFVRDFVLEQAVTTKPWSKIEYKGYSYQPYLNQGNLGENDLIDARSITYGTITAKLKKAQGHVAASKWASLAIRDRDFVADNFSIINADFPRIFTLEIANGLTGFNNQAVVGGAFDIIAAGDFHHTNIPTKTFRVVSKTIRDAGGSANTMAMNSKTFEALSLNTWMRSGAVVFGAVEPLTNAGARTATHTLLPGYTIYIDETLPDGTIFDYWKEAAVFLRGPTRTSTVDDNLKWKTSQVVDQWYGFFLRNASLGQEITGTNS